MNIGSHGNSGKKSVFWTNIRFCSSPPLVGWRTAASWLDRCNVVIAVPPVPVPMNTFAVALLSVAHWGNRSSSNHNHVIGSYLSLSAPPLLLVGAPLFYLVFGLIAYDMSWNLASNKFSLSGDSVKYRKLSCSGLIIQTASNWCYVRDS